jgi:nucleoside-diphosphate-sugar epimerase
MSISDSPSAKRTAVIFGGCGFFGTHLARALSDDPAYAAIILADIREPRELRPRVRHVHCDVREPISIDAGGEVEIYNFAAVHTTPGHEDWEYYWTNIQGAISVCRYADAASARLVVFTSTMLVYGPQETQVDEETQPRPTNAYGRSKLLAEQIHSDWQRKDTRNRLVIVRPAVVFGEGERGNFTRLAGLLRLGLFVYPGRTDTIKACAPVEDLARSIHYMASFGEPSLTYIYAYPERTTSAHINRCFCAVGGFREPRLVVPLWLMLTAATGFELLSRLGIKTPIHRDRIKKLAFSTNVFPKQLTARGWRFRYDLTDALRRWKNASDFK